MKEQVSLFHKTLPISTLPLLVAGTSYLVQKLVSASQLLSEKGVPNSVDDSQKKKFDDNLLTLVALFLQQFRILIMGVYDNYMIFIAVMMILHIAVNYSQYLIPRTLKRFNESKDLHLETQIRPKLLNLLTLLLSYTISFFFINLMAITFSTYCTSLMFNSKGLDRDLNLKTQIKVEEMMFSGRENSILLRNLGEEEYEEERDRILAYQEPTLLKVTDETLIDGLALARMAFSKDFKTVFALEEEGFVVYNISERDNPMRLSSYHKRVFPPLPSTVLSPKERFFLVDNENSTWIIDVTDVKNPNLIGDFEFRKRRASELYQSNIAISSQEKHAIFCNPGIYIYDISDLTNPKLLFHESQETTVIALSRDDRTAFIGRSKSLQIWNVTDFGSPNVISSISVEGVVSFLSLSSDQKRIFVFCLSESKQTFRLYIVNITDPANPILQNQVISGSLPKDVVLEMLSFAVSSDDSFALFAVDQVLNMISLRDYQTTTIKLDETFQFPNIGLLPNGRDAVIISGGMIRFAEFYLNFPDRQSSSLRPNYLSHLPFDLPIKYTTLVSSDKRVFITMLNTENVIYELLFDIDLSNYSEPIVAEKYYCLFCNAPFVGSPDGKNIYYLSNYQKSGILSTEGKLSRIITQNFEKERGANFVVSSDKTLFTLTKDNNSEFAVLSIYDISDLDSFKLLKDISLKPDIFLYSNLNGHMTLSNDEKTLFYIQNFLHIIDISDRANPVLRSNNFSFKDSLSSDVKVSAFSSDSKTCFLITQAYLLKRNYLITIDLSNHEALKLLSKMDLPLDTNFYLSVSSNDEILFMSTSKALITLDISDRTSIKILEVQVINVSNFVPIRNGENLLIFNENGVDIISRKSKYALHIPAYEFELGGTYSHTVKVLEQNQEGNLHYMKRNYKFIETSLYNPKIKPLDKFSLSYPALPNWIYFDKENAVLHLDLTTPLSVASHKIRFSASTQILAADFEQIKGVNCRILMENLVKQGYLDSENFLTLNFNENTPLVLYEQFASFEQEIRKILRPHRIELVTTISIESSLKLHKSKSFEISTPRASSVAVRIDLLSNGSYFLTQAFSAIKMSSNEEKTSLVIEGALLNVNEALRGLLIDIQDGESCEGKVAISDTLNPVQTYRFDKIENYIKRNENPRMSSDPKYWIQSQLKGIVLTAGEHFHLEFDPKTFIDVNGRQLSYSLEMPNKNRTVPNWIALRGLSIMGVPPEDFWPYKMEFVIKASNEYKSVEETFTLTIGLSFVIILKRVVFIVGYLFTAFKAWQHSDKVYNILGQKYYKYPRTIRLNVEKEISEKCFYPVVFVNGEVVKLGNRILKVMKINFGASDEIELINHFTGEHHEEGLKRQKITEAVESSILQNPKWISRISQNQDEEVELKELACQLIMNKLAMRRIKSEKTAWDIFCMIKSKWLDLVELEEYSSKFIVNNRSLAQELQGHNVDVDESDAALEYSLDNKVDDSESLINSSPSKRSVEKELIISTGRGGLKINMGLLKDAIIAHAFDNQNVYANKNYVQVHSKEVLTNFSSMRDLKSLLKLNLVYLIEKSKKKLGYGLKYKFIGNKMVFYGKLKEKIKNKTIIIQIMSERGWILKELAIQGSNDNGDDNVIESIPDVL